MKQKRLMISILSIFFLAGCAGDFCAVYHPVPPISPQISETLVAENRTSAVAIVANEKYYMRHCAG